LLAIVSQAGTWHASKKADAGGASWGREASNFALLSFWAHRSATPFERRYPAFDVLMFGSDAEKSLPGCTLVDTPTTPVGRLLKVKLWLRSSTPSGFTLPRGP
jgi:hypothetical protein